MNQQEEHESATAEADDSQLAQEPILQPADVDADDAPGIENSEERPETPEETIVRLESELVDAQQQAAGALETMQRTVAEYENAGKRRERQNEERIMRATENMMRQLLPVIDDLELAFQNVPQSGLEEDRAWLKGFEQIKQKLMEILAGAQVEPLPATGEFDPTQHEAISNEPNPDVPSGYIIQTLRTGYSIQDRILRPALVRVAQ